jgi:hypothetical protein
MTPALTRTLFARNDVSTYTKDAHGKDLCPLAAAEKLCTVSRMCMRMTSNLDSWVVDGLITNKAKKTHHELRLHTAVSVGRMESYIVGGFGGGQWLHTLTGPAISQITDCIDQARPGQVVISHQCVTMLRRGETVRIQGRDSAGGVNAGMSPNASNSLLDVLDSELHAGAYSLLNTGEFERMHVHDQEGGAVRAAPLVSDTSERNVSVGYVRFEEKIRRYSQTWKEGSAIEPQRSLKSALQSFAPAPVLRAIRSGSASSGELRRLTILFLHLDPPQEDSGLLQKIQHVCGIIQREVGGAVARYAVSRY